jgi:hypothetical protein
MRNRIEQVLFRKLAYKVLRIEYRSAGARGREGRCTYSLSLMYRLNQTESAILILFCCD